MLWALAAAGRRLRDRPSLLLAGLGFAIVEVAALASVVAVALLVGPRQGLLVLVLWPVAHDAVAAVLTPTVLPGLYALVREPESSGRDALRASLRGYAPVALAGGVARVLAGVLALLALPLVVAGGLTLATPLTAGLYGLELLEAPDPTWSVLGLVGLAWLAWSLALAPVAFVDLLALDGTAPRRAWRVSIRRTAGRPRALVGYTLLRWTLVAAPFVLATLLVRLAPVTNTNPAWYVAVAPLLVLGKTVEGAVHAVVYEARFATPRPATPSWWPSGLGAARTALAALLVVGLVAGAGVVRVTDVRPSPTPDAPPVAGAGDAPARYERAIERTLASSRTARVVARTGRGETTTVTLRARLTVDFETRTIRADRDPRDGHDTTIYATDGLVLTTVPLREPAYTLHRGTVGEWTALAAPGFPAYRDATIQRFPAADASWSIQRRTPEAVVLRRGPEAGPIGGFAVDDTEAVRNRTATARIDRDTGRLTRLSVTRRIDKYRSENRSELVGERRQGWRATWSYDDPAATGPAPSGPWALVWDLLYY